MNSSLGFTEIEKKEEIEKEMKPVAASNKDRQNRTFKRRTGKATNFLNSMQEDYLPKKPTPVPEEEDGIGTSWTGGSPEMNIIKQNAPAPASEQEESMLREGMEQQRQHYQRQQYQRQENDKHIPTYARAGEDIQHYTELTNGQEITGSKDELMTKLNYIVHMLEEQQDQRSGSVTEEMVLYMFLGVFVIFVVDSFSKTGKYCRG